MENSNQTLKQQRVETLFKDCQDAIIGSTLSAFGLNQGMFTDRAGGNVTTLHNFEKDDNEFIHERDHANFAQANADYDREIYSTSSSEWNEKKQENKSTGIDGYTGETFKNPNSVDLDHIKPLKQIHDNKKNHLAHETGSKQGQDTLKDIANNSENLVSTDASINRSKGKKTNSEFIESTSKERLEEMGVNKTLMLEKEKKANNYIEDQANYALVKKQSKELLTTGTSQAGSMATKQMLGMLLTELISICFTEIKLMLKEEDGISIQSLNKLKDRMLKHSYALAKKIPSIFSEGLKGGLSGFVSNLITFLINQFLSTAKRIVTIIREGLLGIYKAFKMVFFPPEGMSKEEIWRNAIKIFSTTIISAIIVSLGEAIANFVKTIPFLIPIADTLSTVLTGIIAGLASAFTAYAIDRIFDKFTNRHDENMIELLLSDTEKRNELAGNLVAQLDISLQLVRGYNQSIKVYDEINNHYIELNEIGEYVQTSTSSMVSDMEQLTKQMQKQVKKSKKVIEYIENTQPTIENFLATR